MGNHAVKRVARDSLTFLECQESSEALADVREDFNSMSGELFEGPVGVGINGSEYVGLGNGDSV